MVTRKEEKGVNQTLKVELSVAENGENIKQQRRARTYPAALSASALSIVDHFFSNGPSKNIVKRGGITKEKPLRAHSA